ncbi:lipopolysaccharide biosynthesis protein [Undibacterium sp. WLHG33]|uniref:lipopolysaccharide biosynthesis protein n=1 Tax=Undibacterium sp. WLHG33 TaxID=3412482 RepID=UPI003C2D1506
MIEKIKVNLNFSSDSMFWVMFGALFSAFVTIIGFRVTGEFSGAEGFGNGVLRYGIILLLAGLFAGPTSQALGKYYFDESSFEKRTELLSASLQLVLIQVIIAEIIVTFCYLAGKVNGVIYFSSYCVALLFESLRPICSAWLQSERRFFYYAVGLIFDALLRPVLAWGFSHLGLISTELILASYATSSVLSVGLMLLLIAKKTDILHIKIEQILKLIKYGYPLITNSLLGWIVSAGDRYVIAAALGAEASGIYIAASAIGGRIPLMLGNVFETYHRPQIYEALASKSFEKLRSRSKKWLIDILRFGLMISVAIFFFMPIIEKYLLASEFRAGAKIIIMISFFAYLISAICFIPQRILYALEKTGLVSTVEFSGLLFMGVTVYFCGLVFGLNGAAMGLLLAFTMRLIVSIALAKRALGPSI